VARVPAHERVPALALKWLPTLGLVTWGIITLLMAIQLLPVTLGTKAEAGSWGIILASRVVLLVIRSGIAGIIIYGMCSVAALMCSARWLNEFQFGLFRSRASSTDVPATPPTHLHVPALADPVTAKDAETGRHLANAVQELARIEDRRQLNADERSEVAKLEALAKDVSGGLTERKLFLIQQDQGLENEEKELKARRDWLAETVNKSSRRRQESGPHPFTLHTRAMNPVNLN
jgi:hypothetical protein